MISAIAFGGVPLRILSRLLKREFRHATSPALIAETRRNLMGKLSLDETYVNQYLNDILAVSTACLPTGKLEVLAYKKDNVVLETALMGGCDVLVTGDKKHLLPLSPFQGIIIESPTHFLKRLDFLKI